MGEKCSSTCPTKDHATFGECVKAKGIKVAYCNSATGGDYTAQRKLDRDLDAYKDARRQGVQPESTNRTAVDEAMRISDKTGEAYNR